MLDQRERLQQVRPDRVGRVELVPRGRRPARTESVLTGCASATLLGSVPARHLAKDVAWALVLAAVPVTRGGRSCWCTCGRAVASPGEVGTCRTVGTFRIARPRPTGCDVNSSRRRSHASGAPRRLDAGRSFTRRPLASLAPENEEPETVIDRLREQIQQRLDQLAGEADRLRKALAALDPRSPAKPASTPPARRACPRRDPKPKTPATKSAPARRATEAAAGSSRRTAPGATKASVLAALAGGEAMTAGQVADKTGLARGTVSTTLSKLSKSGEVQKAERGYRLAPASPALLAGEVARRGSLLSRPRAALPCRRRAPDSGSGSMSTGDRRRRRSPQRVRPPTAPVARRRGLRPCGRGASSGSCVRGSARSADRRSRRCSATSSSGRCRRSLTDCGPAPDQSIGPASSLLDELERLLAALPVGRRGPSRANPRRSR